MDQVQISHRPGPERHAKRRISSRISLCNICQSASYDGPWFSKTSPSFNAIFLEFDQIVLACAEQRCHLVEHIRLPAAWKTWKLFFKIVQSVLSFVLVEIVLRTSLCIQGITSCHVIHFSTDFAETFEKMKKLLKRSSCLLNLRT